MSLKFYTKKDNRLCLYCMRDNKLYWFIAPFLEEAHWFEHNKTLEDLVEITESEAQKICNGRVYTVEAWIPKKEKGVKIYKSLYDIPTSDAKKTPILILVAIILFVLFSIFMAAVSSIEATVAFWGASIITVGIGALVGKVLGLELEEGIAVGIFLSMIFSAILK